MTCCCQIIGLSAILADVTTSGWRPQMADAAAPGILIVAFYLVVTMACAWALHVARIGAQMSKCYRKKERRIHDRTTAYRASTLFWAMLTLLCVILGVNKRFDLEYWLTELGRQIALDHGWYDARWQFQEMLVIGIVFGGVSVLAALLCLMRSMLPRHVLALVGAALLGCFVLARTLSFHHLDDILAIDLLGIRLRSLVELTGIFLVGLCAVKNCWWYHFKRVTPSPAEAPQPKLIGH